jgi:hypothetical protein
MLSYNSLSTQHHAMSTKSKPKATDKNHTRDSTTFERLPEQTKEMMKLKDHAEKASGHERVEATRKIEDKAHRAEE